ncbi:hypothetical protein [Peredibacter starrii]|uniref:Lipoprotein n=1 Tax=Peredibacter starrii TaxID=28202 RepID=A0AAX4HRZ7_9BACT|nr:hypothetical protein [Peredibacter starrii]WPU65775.1 hypothetical protein SOO65_03350 [Peredibacter starrii]
MRWLIFLLIISCGKHQEPKALDLRDNDGDQIVNANELDGDNYIANVETIGSMKGKLLVQHNGILEVDFNNQTMNASEVITASEKKISETKYFSEGSKILMENAPKLEFKSNLYKVSLQFNETNSHPDEIYFSHDSRKFFVTEWKKFVSFELTSSDLKLIMEGNAHFILTKKYAKKASGFEASEDITVTRKTYRVFLGEESKSRVLYVSKQHEFEELLKDLKIYQSTEIKEDDLFFHAKEISNKTWFYRHFKNGDKALVYSEIQNLSELFKKRFTITKQVVSRENGKTLNELKIDNKNLPQIYLKIRPSRTMRKFRPDQKQTKHSEGGGGGREGNGRSWSYCTHFLTLFENLAPEAPLAWEVIGELGLHGKEFQYQEEYDEKGSYLNIKAATTENEIKLSLPNRPATTFKITGQNTVKCDSGNKHVISPPVSTNEEAKFSLEIESYVEKLN